MTDYTEPKIQIILDKSRNLLFNLKGMKAYEKVTGKNPLKPQSFDLNDLNELQAMLWACLIHEDESLTMEQVESIVNAANVRVVQLGLVDALHAAYPKPEKKGGNKEYPLAVKSQSGTG